MGPILLGTVLDIWLYGVMVTQTAIYYVTFKRYAQTLLIGFGYAERVLCLTRDYKWIKILVRPTTSRITDGIDVYSTTLDRLSSRY